MVSSGLLRRVALVRPTRLNNPEDTILHSHRRENLKSYRIMEDHKVLKIGISEGVVLMTVMQNLVFSM
jgi:hypothetical protein